MFACLMCTNQNTYLSSMDIFIVRKLRSSATEVDITNTTDGNSQDHGVQDSHEGEASQTAAKQSSTTDKEVKVRQIKCDCTRAV